MRRFIIIAGLVAAVGLVASFSPSTPSPDASSNALVARTIVSVGQHLEYDMSYRARHRSDLGEAMSVEANVDLLGTLVIERPTADALVLTLPALARHEFSLNDQSLLPDPAAVAKLVTTHRAWIPVATDGALGDPEFAHDTPPFFMHLVGSLLSELQLERRTTTVWTARETTARGRGIARYTRRGGLIERRRVRYDSQWVAPGAEAIPVSGFATFELDSEGQITSLDASESLVVEGAGGATNFELSFSIAQREQTVARSITRPDNVVTVPMDIREVSPEAERRGRQDRIDGMTVDQIINDTLQYARGGRMPDHERWLWRAVGLLEMQPELCAKLVPILRDEGVGSHERALLLDLLASAGHPLAQAAMVAGLDALATRDDPAYDLLIQRLGFIETPTDATVGHLQRAMAEPNDSALAASAALGSAIHRRDDAVGRAANAELRVKMGDATDPDAQVALLKALGNAGQAGNVDVVGEMVESSDASVRAAAAIALRRAPDRDLLFGLVSDSESFVQNTALDVLREVGVTLADRERVARMVLDGAFGRDHLGRLLPLLGSADSGLIGDALAHLPGLAPDDVKLKRQVARQMASNPS